MELIAEGRDPAGTAGRPATEAETNHATLWCAVESRGPIEAMLPRAAFRPDLQPPAGCAALDDPGEAAALALRGHLDVSGPITAPDLATASSLPDRLVSAGLAHLEAEGFAVRGALDPALAGEQWCSRRLLMRVHSYTRERLRRAIAPVSPRDLMRFLLRWQGVAPGTQRERRAGVAAVIAQLQGAEAPAGGGRRRFSPPDRRVPIGVARRPLPLRERGLGTPPSAGWGPRGEPAQPTVPVPRDAGDPGGARRPAMAAPGGPGSRPPVRTRQRRHPRRHRGAARARRALHRRHRGALATPPDRGRGGAVGRGRQGDGRRRRLRRGALAFRRAPARRGRPAARPASRSGRHGRRRGRSLLPEAVPVTDHDGLAEAVAEQLLARWGVVFHDLLARETLAVPWRDILWALRRMEDTWHGPRRSVRVRLQR